jgi:DNA-binding LacI/PurR family transcriptional regulator
VPQSSPSGQARRRPPGMNDVARLAGVSQKTVSRVVNNERYVSEEAREKVLAAAGELGYRVNSAARALITGRFQRIGVVSLGTALYGPTTLQVALERATREAGLSLTIAHTVEGRPDSIQQAVDWLLDQGLDAIVLSEPIDEGQNLRLDADLPVVSFEGAAGLPPDRVAFVRGPDVESCREAVDHLLDLGHRRVWHLAGPQRWWVATKRLEGWLAAHRARRIEPPEPLEGDWSPTSGYRLGRQLAANLDVTAVFCANDDMAIGLMRALDEIGRPVPEAVSVVGFDDIPAAAYLKPPLTTVRQDLDELATRAIEVLLQLLPGAASGEPGDEAAREPDRRLIIRASTAPPPRTQRSDTQ